MEKKLKKVDSLEKTSLNQQLIMSKIDAINTAYKSGSGFTIDKANKDLFDLLEKNGVKSDNPFYIEMRNHTWQQNHLKVIASISQLMQEKGRMPTTTEIVANSRLSAETVYKHLRDFKDHDLHKHEHDKFRFMVDRVLSTVFTLGVQGDIRACKVYLDYFGTTSQPPGKVPGQNNYIQINNLQITTDELENLPSETLQQIENLIKAPEKVNMMENRIINKTVNTSSQRKVGTKNSIPNSQN